MVKKIMLFLFSLFITASNAQLNKELKADNKYQKFAYIDAIVIYSKLVNKGYKSESMLLKLANANYFSANYPEAAKWYKQLFEMNKQVDNEIYFRYSNTLKSIGETDLANQFLQRFNEQNILDSRGIRYKENPNYLNEIEKSKDTYSIGNVDFNSKFSDYGIAFWKDQLVFSSNRPERLSHTKKNAWDGQPLSALFYEDNSKVKSFKELTSKFNISTPVFTKDGNTVYFTQNNSINNKRAYNSNNTTLLKIYKAEFINDQWQNIKELPFNSNEYSCAHPALSYDEKTLFFASDMPGTFGDSDIFNVAILGNDSYGIPQNLGDKINTEGKESFPFITSEGQLYFSSNGHLGLGGLDIFKTDLNTNNAVVDNVGEPVNSAFDDFAIYLNSDVKTGFFSSNRPGGLGFDDVYAITNIYHAPKYSLPSPFFSGNVMDKWTNAPIDSVKVSVFDINFNSLNYTYTNIDGSYQTYTVAGQPGDVFYIRAEQKDYITAEQRLILPENLDDIKVQIKLDKRIVEVGRGDDLAKVFEIENVVYFDFNRSDIREDAIAELAKVYEVLSQYPKMKIDIRSHTDSRGSSAYNQKLSDQRAKGTINWLIKQGIDKSQLSGKGYGKTQLVNACLDGVSCTEEEHQKNRRSEFIIVDL